MAEIFSLKGKIGADNAAKFAEELMAFANEHGKISLDASELEYISSSGIRGLMKLYYQQGELRIDNVSDGVFSIFYAAGLNELFEINTKLIELTNDGWEVVGAGASGTVYRIDRDTAVKVYNGDVDFEYVNQERELARRAISSGIPAVIPSRNAKVGSRYATILELVNSSTLGELLDSEPDRFDELMDEYVAMVKHLHSTEDKRNYFPYLQDLWLKYEYMVREGLRPDDADFVVDVYKNSKRGKNLLHGDIHPGNVMISDGEMVLVDMSTMSTGPELFDVITVFRLSMFGENVGLKEQGTKSMKIRYELFKPFWEAFAMRYFETKDQKLIDRITQQMMYITALDLAFSINTIPPEKAREFYKVFGTQLMDTYINPNRDLIRKIYEEGRLDL